MYLVKDSLLEILLKLKTQAHAKDQFDITANIIEENQERRKKKKMRKCFVSNTDRNIISRWIGSIEGKQKSFE